LKLQTSFELEQ